MDSQLLQRFQKLIAAHMGVHVREQDQGFLEKTLVSRQQALKISHGEKYYDLLKTENTNSVAEWRQLAILLTNQESYFFRDLGQFALLRRKIIPELLEQNKEHRTLRIWSAGCSTGQEPYSIAILVDMLLPFRSEWRIFIIGTDVSEAALEKARRGAYSNWSFRNTDRDVQQRYFHRQQKEYVLDTRIRQSVTFKYGNLLQDDFPSRGSELFDIDLILCRNVFIYFKRDVVTKVLSKFDRTLRNDGYLLTGHAELHEVPMYNLKARTFPETVIYQKVSTKTPSAPTAAHATEQREVAPLSTSKPALQHRQSTPKPSAERVPPNTQNATQPNATLIEVALKELKSGHNAAALEKLEPLVNGGVPDLAALCLAAQAHANSGRYDQAAEYCRSALKLNTFATLPFHILARIAEELGDRSEAKLLLKKVSYLAPMLIMPYVELGAIYEHEGDTERASKMRVAALELLSVHAPDEVVPTDPLSADRSVTVRELKRHLSDLVS